MFYPLAILVMLVLAMPFAYQSARAGGMAIKIFLRHHDRHSVLRLKQYFCLHERIAKRAVFYFRAHAVADDVDTLPPLRCGGLNEGLDLLSTLMHF